MQIAILNKLFNKGPCLFISLHKVNRLAYIKRAIQSQQDRISKVKIILLAKDITLFCSSLNNNIKGKEGENIDDTLAFLKASPMPFQLSLFLLLSNIFSLLVEPVE